MRVFLVDNGSLRPDAWVSLCAVAAALSERLGRPVEPASVLHSTRIPAEQLPPDCPPTMTWERAVKAALAEGERSFLGLPFFFGPTGAIVDYLPARAAAVAEREGAFAMRWAPFLADPVPIAAPTLVDLLAARVRETIAAEGLVRPPVVLVDHGSPKPAVAAVRDRLGPTLAAALGTEAAGVAVASMERREGPEYAFTEPLLASALRAPGLPAGEVVVAMLFLSPGRHAGEGGDVATICAEAEAARPGLRTHRTALLGSHPAMVELLEARYRAAIG